jgi:hypothetical protein
MHKATSRHEILSDLRVSRTVAEFVALDAATDTEHQPGVIWQTVKNDPRFAELVHTLLEYGSKHWNGIDDDAIRGYEAFIEGASFALEAIRQTIVASEADHNFNQALYPPERSDEAGV